MFLLKNKRSLWETKQLNKSETNSVGKCNEQKRKLFVMSMKKESMTGKQMCQDLTNAKQLAIFYDAVREIEYADTPDYDYLYNL